MRVEHAAIGFEPLCHLTRALHRTVAVQAKVGRERRNDRGDERGRDACEIIDLSYLYY
jgi:hypothetical protein